MECSYYNLNTFEQLWLNEPDWRPDVKSTLPLLKIQSYSQRFPVISFFVPRTKSYFAIQFGKRTSVLKKFLVQSEITSYTWNETTGYPVQGSQRTLNSDSSDNRHLHSGLSLVGIFLSFGTFLLLQFTSKQREHGAQHCVFRNILLKSF